MFCVQRLSTNCVIVSLICWLTWAAEKVPSVDQIEDYDDDILKEIFKGKSNGNENSNTNINPPQPSNLSSRRSIDIEPIQRKNVPDYTDSTSPPEFYGRNTNNRGLDGSNQNAGISNYNNYNNWRGPNNFNTYQQQQQPRTIIEPFANLIGQGAQTFYHGARQFGQNFGVNPQYDNPLVNYAAGFFG